MSTVVVQPVSTLQACQPGKDLSSSEEPTWRPETGGTLLKAVITPSAGAARTDPQ